MMVRRVMAVVVCWMAAVSLQAQVAASAQTQDENPAPPVTQLPLRSGAELFAETGCAHCHGVRGRGVKSKGPSLRSVGHRLSEAEIERQIHDGGKTMPAFDEALSAEEIAVLGKYLKAGWMMGGSAR